MSSLVFLVVIGVWAAYFIQYWVRRRDHLATARSVDQFSESMRVLERRTALPAAGPSSSGRASAAPDPARVSGPQLLVRPAVSSPVSAGVGDRAVPGVAGGAPSGRAGGASGNDAAAARARRNRGMVLLGALSTWLVAVPLVALGMLGSTYLAVPVVSLAAALAWVRRSARSARRARRTPSVSPATRATHRASGSQSRVHDTPTTRRDPEHVVHTRRPQGAHQASAAEAKGPVAEEAAATLSGEGRAQSTGPSAPSRPRGELYDVQAVEAAARQGEAPTADAADAAAQPMRPLVDEDDIPLTWDPVPVPRPTYTLKARATRPAPAAADLVGDADTEYAAREGDLAVRQVAGA